MTEKGWRQWGDNMWVKQTPTMDLVVSQTSAGDWRAEYSQGRRWGRLQIARVATKAEAMKVCERKTP